MQPILQQWVKVCRDYRTKTYDRLTKLGDFPYYYRERTQTGFLAAATWMSSGVALEEWCTEKTGADGSFRNGRGDLWLQRGKFRLHIEAKHVEVPLGSKPEGAVRLVREELQRARNDACDIKHYLDEDRAGVLFASPVVPVSDEADAPRRFLQWRDGLLKLNPLALAAFYDPAPYGKDHKRFYVGLALLIGSATRAAAPKRGRA